MKYIFRTSTVVMSFLLGCTSSCALALVPSQPSTNELSMTFSTPGPFRPWSAMNSRERAKMWPMLEFATQEQYWRMMTLKERRQMQRRLSQLDRERFKMRFCNLDQVKKNTRQIDLQKIDREALRAQIIEQQTQQNRR